MHINYYMMTSFLVFALFIYLFFVLNRQLCYIFQCLHNQHALHRSVLNCDNEMCALKTILSKSERITLQSL